MLVGIMLVGRLGVGCVVFCVIMCLHDCFVICTLFYVVCFLFKRGAGEMSSRRKPEIADRAILRGWWMGG